MPEKMIFPDLGNCNLCGLNLFEKIADKLRDSDNPRVYKCLSCGHIQLLPRPSGAEEKQFYDENRQDRAIRSEINLEKLRTSFKSDIIRRADFISARFPRDKSILDIGCGYGFFLEEMKSRGYNIKGIEVSEERRNLARTITDIPILNINLTEPYEGDELADIVTLFHVLEHIIDPAGFCRNMIGLLRKGGCLIIEVPNVDELMLETCPAYNKFYWIRAHLNYFNKSSLETVFRKAGLGKFEIMYVQRYGVENMSNWMTNGTPQIEKPVLQIADSYSWLESYYRKYLEDEGRSDSLLAVSFS